MFYFPIGQEKWYKKHLRIVAIPLKLLRSYLIDRRCHTFVRKA